jgi:phage gp36-like protein
MPTQYATLADLAAYGLTPSTLTTVSEADQTAALQVASGVADGYIAAVRDLPISQWGLDLRLAVAKVAAWELIRRRGFKPGSTDAETLRASYQDAIKWLEGVSTGKVSPFGMVDTSSPNVTAQDAPFVVAPLRSAGAEGADRHMTFFGHEPSDTVGTVTSPKPRGW